MQLLMQPHIKYLTDVYKQLLARDELVYAEKCSFMEALIILRYRTINLRSEASKFDLLFLFVD